MSYSMLRADEINTLRWKASEARVFCNFQMCFMQEVYFSPRKLKFIPKTL